jgi:hypothetical protein
MTTMNEVELGEDLNDLIKNHPDFYNLSGKSFNDWELYFVKKHIGFYQPENQSGIFLLEATLVDDEFVGKIW